MMNRPTSDISNRSFDNSETSYDADSNTLFDKISGLMRDEIEVYTPESERRVQELIFECHRERIPFTVVSTGRNWGYGGALPVQDRGRVISLRRLNRILDFNRELGILHIEAGVTQGQLETYLKNEGLNFYVPNTGAGPDGSLLGNALERGFGVSPIEDHADAVLSIHGFLSDGSEYDSALSEVDPLLAACFPHGVGPNIDRLASQSSWIAITSAKFQLIRRAGHQELMMVTFDSLEWPKIIEALQTLTRRGDLPLGGYKILNRQQVAKSTQGSRWIRALIRQREWTLMFFIRSERNLSAPLRRATKLVLRDHGFASTVWSERKIKTFAKILGLFRAGGMRTVRSALLDLLEFFRLGDGYTSVVGHRVRTDNHGLVWLSPLCPMTADHVARLTELTKSWGPKNGGSNLSAATWTWTVLNERTLALVMPIVFPIETSQAEVWKDFRGKLEALRLAGFAPYRYPVECMDYVRDCVAPRHFSRVDKVERALDPLALLNAGRYS